MTPALLVEHAAWLRRLAAYLVRDGADADDMVQETWEAALVSPPDAARPARPWLARVLTNAIRSTGRSSARRIARERGVVAPDETPTAEELLARMQLHEHLAKLITSLEEPYRATLLLRFYDGRSASDIARDQGIPAGTVRWRLNEGLRRLRERLDELESAPRWRAVLAPLAVAPARRARPLHLWMRPVSVGGAAATVLAGALLLHVRPQDATTSRQPPTQSPAHLSARPIRPDQERTEEPTMATENVRRVAAFLGVALPALVAGADQSSDPKIEQGINMCVQIREKLYECREEFADAMVAVRNPPAEQRAAMRRKVIEEITSDGSGPLEPRRKACAAMIKPEMTKPGQGPTQAQIDSKKKVLDECSAKASCKERVECFGKAVPPRKPKN